MMNRGRQRLVDKLLLKILSGEVEAVSKEQHTLLSEFPKRCLSTIRITLASELECPPDPSSDDLTCCVDTCIHFAMYLKAPEAFPWLRQLLFVDGDFLQTNVGFDFDVDLMAALAATAHHQWPVLKADACNAEIDPRMRLICLRTIALLVVGGAVPSPLSANT